MDQPKPNLNIARLSEDTYSRLVALIDAHAPNQWQSISEVLTKGRKPGLRIISQFATSSRSTMYKSRSFSTKEQHRGNSMIKYWSPLRKQTKFGQIDELFTHTGSDEDPSPSQRYVCVHPFAALSALDQAHADTLEQSHHRLHVISDRLALVSDMEVIWIGNITGHVASRQFCAGSHGFQDSFLLVIDLTAYDDF